MIHLSTCTCFQILLNCCILCCFIHVIDTVLTTDKQNALRRECTFKIEIVLEIGVAGVNIYLKKFKDNSFDAFRRSSSTSSVG